MFNQILSFILLVCISVVSVNPNALAQDMSCDMNMSEMSKMPHHMSDEKENSPMAMADNCCDQDCTCPINGCTTSIAFNSIDATAALMDITGKIQQFNFAVIDTSQSNLFKPPILS